MSRAEERKIKALAREYSRKGYSVFAQVAGFEMPPKFGEFAPDLVAKNDRETILVEVVHGGGDTTRKSAVAELASYASVHPNTRFDLVVVPRESAKQVSSSSVLKHLRGRTLRELEMTSQSQPRTFFVLFAIALEDLLLAAAAKKGVEVSHFVNLSDLARQLQARGIITPMIVEFAEKAWDCRNRAAHDGPNDRIDPSGISPTEFLSKFQRLLDDYGWKHDLK